MTETTVSSDALARLKAQATRPILDTETIELAKSLGRSFIGIIRNEELLDDIFRARLFARPSAYYGHRYGKKVAAVLDVRPGYGMDLHVTDEDGVLKNDPVGQSAASRLKAGRLLGYRSIVFFGGSTMVGTGSRSPVFTIPALVEKILELKYGIKSICVNQGLGGTFCQDALNILVSETLREPPDCVVFYDGWNCCSYLSLINSVKNHRQFGSALSVYAGMGVRHLEHDLILRSQYYFLPLLGRTLNISVNYVAVAISKLLPSKLIRRIANSIVGRFFSLRASRKIHEMLASVSETEAEIDESSKHIVRDYWRIHSLAESVCKSSGILFCTFMQPLVFWGNKKLTKDERTWRESGHSSGDPRLFESFIRILMTNGKPDYFTDLTDVFDSTDEQVYIDSGHLNRLGYFLVSERIAEHVAKRMAS